MNLRRQTSCLLGGSMVWMDFISAIYFYLFIYLGFVRLFTCRAKLTLHGLMKTEVWLIKAVFGWQV